MTTLRVPAIRRGLAPGRLLTLGRMGAIGAGAVLLSGCTSVILSPAGDVTLRERNLVIASTLLMLLIIVPVITATLLFAWRYRATNTAAAYSPDWHHSTQLEVMIWTAPLLIIVALGAMTWMATHILDPYRPIARLSATQSLPADAKPLTVDVVALDWKWLFIYPEQGIATVNDLSLPTNVPIDLHITSGTVMNAFFIPALSGQIYAMAGMETRLSLVGNKLGDYNGQSSHYSGTGFSHMNFGTHVLSAQDFAQWVAATKAKKASLDAKAYAQLEKPSERVPATYYSAYEPDLYKKILNMCTAPGKMCQDEMEGIDAMGGGGERSEANYQRLVKDGRRLAEGSEAPAATFPAASVPVNSLKKSQTNQSMQGQQPDAGKGFAMPGAPAQTPAPAQLNAH